MTRDKLKNIDKDEFSSAELVQKLKDECQALRQANNLQQEQIQIITSQLNGTIEDLQHQRKIYSQNAKELGQLHTFIERILETVGQVIIVTSTEGRIVKINCEAHATDHEGSQYHGILIDHLIEKNDISRLERQLPPLPYPIRSVLVEALRHQPSKRLNTEIKGAFQLEKASPFLPYICSGATLHNKQGKEEGAVFSFTDITDIKEKEREVVETNEKFRQASKAVKDAFVVCDDDDHILFWNQAAQDMFGFTESQMLGKKLHNIIVPKRYQKEYFNKKEHFKRTGTGPIINMTRQLEALHANGHEFPVELSLSAYTLNDRHYSVGTVRDISQRVKIMAELKEARQKADEANDAKGLFLANMSHEIRTPMNGVMGSAKLLQDTSLNPEQRDYVEMIHSSCQSLLVVINDILDLSKITSGKMTIETIPFSMKTLVEETTLVVQHLLQSKRLDLSVNISEAVDFELMGDPTRLRQVVINLLTNAIKFTEEGRVRLEVEVLRETADEMSFLTKISDTGIGMTEQQLNKVFESFTQADASTTRRFGGTGLGTTISKSLIELMGGNIGATSTVGKGSTFFFELNLKKSKQKTKKQNIDHNVKRNYQATVLVAEDNLINLKVATKTLSKLGLDLLTASNGAEVIELVQQRGDDIDLILMDIQMPVMNGEDATKKLLASGWGKPIIPMTANIMEQDLKRYRELGMVGHIGKPFDLKLLISILDQALGT